MILLCRAYCTLEYSGPDFMLAELTDEFLATLDARRRLAASLGNYGDAFQFDSIYCHDFSPVWFREFDDEEELLGHAGESASIVVIDRAPVLPETVDGVRVVCRTESACMQVWPDSFRFECCFEGSDDSIRSETIAFAEFHAAIAAAQRGSADTADPGCGNNTIRRERAVALLEHHKRVLLHRSEPPVTDRDAIVLFGDLCHLLAHQSLDPEDVFRVALEQYRRQSNPTDVSKESAETEREHATGERTVISGWSPEPPRRKPRKPHK